MRESRLVCKIAFVTNKTIDTFELSNATMFLFVHQRAKDLQHGHSSSGKNLWLTFISYLE